MERFTSCAAEEGKIRPGGSESGSEWLWRGRIWRLFWPRAHQNRGDLLHFFRGLLSQGRMSKIDLKIDREIEGSGAESGGPGPSQATSRRVRCLDRGLPRGDKPLWLGANNPTPGLRKTLTAPASGAAARARSRGLCSGGPHLWWGTERKLRQRDLRSITARHDGRAR